MRRSTTPIRLNRRALEQIERNRQMVALNPDDYLPIDPTVGLYLKRGVVSPRIGEHFASVFGSVFGGIRKKDAELLVRDMLGRPSGGDLRVNPEIMLLNSDDDTFRLCGRFLGLFGRKLNRLLFHAEVARLMPDDVLATLVAHELAHAYSEAAPSFMKAVVHFNYNGPLDPCETEELFAYLIMREWGYDDALITRWTKGNRPVLESLGFRC